MDIYRNAIASIESAGSGGYSAIGPTHPRLGRALGRYQVMEANIPQWSQAALGRIVTPDEFLANPQVQDAIFDHQFGGYVEKFGPSGAAQAWFAGPGGVGKTGRKDSLGTSVGQYAEKFNRAIGGAPQDRPQPRQQQGILSTSSPQTEAAPMQQQKATGLLGSLFPNMSADRQDRLAVALSGLSMHPNQGIVQMAGQRMSDRREDSKEAQAKAQEQQQTNRTIAWLETQAPNNPNAAQALQMLAQGVIDPRGALQLAMQKPEAPKQTDDMLEYQYSQQNPEFSDWMMSQRRAGATNINNNVGAGEGAFQKKTGELLAQEAATVVEQGALAQRNMGQIGRLGELLQTVPEGANGAFVGMASRMGLKLDGASDVEAANAIISQLVPQQRPPGSGVMSDADLALFRQSLPQLINTREGNMLIVDTMRGIAEYDMKRGQIARALQLGQISQEQAAQAYEALGNPLQNFQASTSNQPKSGTLPAVPNFTEMTDEELDAYIQKMGGQ